MYYDRVVSFITGEEYNDDPRPEAARLNNAVVGAPLAGGAGAGIGGVGAPVRRVPQYRAFDQISQ